MTTAEPRPSTGALAMRFLRALVATLRWRVVLAIVVAALYATAEATGLVLLVPLLSTLGLAMDDGPASGLARLAAAAFHAAGVTPTLPIVLGLFVVVSILHASLARLHTVLGPALEQRFVVELRHRLYAALLRARWSFLARRRSNDIVHAITVDTERVSAAAYQLLSLLGSAALALVYVAVALRLSAPLTLIVLLGGAVLLALARRRAAAAETLAESYTAASRDLFGTAADGLAGIKVVKTLGAEDRHAAAFDRLSRRFSALYLRMLRGLADSKWRLDVAGALLVSVLLLVAVTAFGLRGGGLLLLLFVFARIVPRLTALQESLQLVATGLPSFATVMALVDACEAEAEGLTPMRGLTPAEGLTPSPAGDVALEAVSFRWRADAAIALDEVSLVIKEGETTALVGRSGAGKSTAADIVMGLLTPSSGQVTVGGEALAGARLAAWRQSIGYVAQDSFLLHDTVRANLAWAVPGASDAAMWEALDHSAARAFVAAHPDGLDAVIGDRGVQLSGGERQRLALARALLARPRLLVLDEATSALDSVGEAGILATIAALHGRMTILLISHRLSTIRGADRVYVIDDGRIVEQGSWAELTVRRDGAFQSLFEAQRVATVPEAGVR